MLTIFTTAKPFRGHIGIIQRNALQSWKLLHPNVEIILFGDDDGAAEVCTELSLRHEPRVERNEYGTKRLDYFFDRAQEIAKNDTLCYVNCDIILMEDFCRSLQHVRAAYSSYLMVGRRWDTDVVEAVDFSNPNWASEMRERAFSAARQREAYWIDYFSFPRGLYHGKIPAFVIGRVYWDNWLIWYAKHSRAAVVDASKSVCAVHQNHDYGYHPQGKEGVWGDEQSQRNFALAGGYKHMRTIESAGYRLGPNGPNRNFFSWYPHLRITLGRHAKPVRAFLRVRLWHPLLNATRPLRSALGLRKAATQTVRKP